MAFNVNPGMGSTQSRIYSKVPENQVASGRGPRVPVLMQVSFWLPIQAPWATTPFPSLSGSVLPLGAGWDAQDITPHLYFATCKRAKCTLHQRYCRVFVFVFKGILILINRSSLGSRGLNFYQEGTNQDWPVASLKPAFSLRDSFQMGLILE